MPWQGVSILLQKPFTGRKLHSRAFSDKADRHQGPIAASIATQRLKSRSTRQGTQRLAPPRRPSAPKGSGTQLLKPPSVGTQVNKKVIRRLCVPLQQAFKPGIKAASKVFTDFHDMQLQSIATFGEKGMGFRPRKAGVPRAAPTLLSRSVPPHLYPAIIVQAYAQSP